MRLQTIRLHGSVANRARRSSILEASTGAAASPLSSSPTLALDLLLSPQQSLLVVLSVAKGLQHEAEIKDHHIKCICIPIHCVTLITCSSN